MPEQIQHAQECHLEVAANEELIQQHERKQPNRLVRKSLQQED